MVWSSPGISLIRVHYELYTYRLYSLDRARPIKMSPWFYWAFDVCTLSYVVTCSSSQTQYLSICEWSSALFLPSKQPCLTAVHKDGLNQVRFLLQLSVHSSCSRIKWYELRITRRQFLLLGEWSKFLTWRTSFAVKCFISIPCNIYHVYPHGGECGVHHELLCCLWWQTTLFTWVYSLLET